MTDKTIEEIIKKSVIRKKDGNFPGNYNEITIDSGKYVYDNYNNENAWNKKESNFIVQNINKVYRLIGNLEHKGKDYYEVSKVNDPNILQLINKNILEAKILRLPTFDKIIYPEERGILEYENYHFTSPEFGINWPEHPNNPIITDNERDYYLITEFSGKKHTFTKDPAERARFFCVSNNKNENRLKISYLGKSYLKDHYDRCSIHCQTNKKDKFTIDIPYGHPKEINVDVNKIKWIDSLK